MTIVGIMVITLMLMISSIYMHCEGEEYILKIYAESKGGKYIGNNEYRVEDRVYKIDFMENYNKENEE